MDLFKVVSTWGQVLSLIYVNNLGIVNLHRGYIFLYTDNTLLLFDGASCK